MLRVKWPRGSRAYVQESDPAHCNPRISRALLHPSASIDMLNGPSDNFLIFPLSRRRLLNVVNEVKHSSAQAIGGTPHWRPDAFALFKKRMQVEAGVFAIEKWRCTNCLPRYKGHLEEVFEEHVPCGPDMS